MHLSKYIQSSSPYIIPRSMTLHFLLPQSGHSKLYPIAGSFSAAPVPSSLCCVKISVVEIEEFSDFSFVLHLRHTRYSCSFHTRIFRIPLHFLQNNIGISYSVKDDM